MMAEVTSRVFGRAAARDMADGFADALQGFANRRDMRHPDSRFRYDAGFRAGEAELDRCRNA